MLISHRHPGLGRRQFHLEQDFAGCLVVGAKHVAAADAFAGKQQGFGHQQTRLGLDAGARQVDAFQRRIVGDVCRRVGIGDLPEHIAGIHVERRNPAVRRLYDRQTLDPRHAHAEGHAEIDIGIRVLLHRQHREHGAGRYIQVSGFRVEYAGFPIGTAGGRRQAQGASRAVGGFRLGRRRIQVRAEAEILDRHQGLGAKLGREIDQIVFGEALPVDGGGTGRKRLRRRIPFTRHVAGGNGQFLDGPDRLARLPVEGVDERLFGHLGDNLAAVGQVGQHRRGRVVPVPDVVVNQLIMPLALAGLDIERDHAVGEQIVAWAVGAETVAGGRFGGQIDMPQFRVSGHGRPDSSIAGNSGAVVEPGFDTDFTGLGNDVKSPQQFTGLRVKAAHVALDVVFRRRPHGNAMRRTDHDHVVHDERRHGGSDVDVLAALAETQALKHVDPAVVAEIRVGQAGFGIERNEEEARRDGKDAPLVAETVVGNAPARALARGGVEPLAFLRPPQPEQLTVAGVEGRDVARGAHGGVHDAVDFKRREGGVELGLGADVRRRIAPGELQRTDVVRVDLVERRIALGELVAVMGRPVSRGDVGPRLAQGRRNHGQGPGARDESRNQTHCSLHPGFSGFCQSIGRAKAAGKNKQSNLPAQEKRRLHYDLKQLRGGANRYCAM